MTDAKLQTDPGPRSIPDVSERAENLRPDGDHADEETQRRKGSSFLDNGLEHDDLP